MRFTLTIESHNSAMTDDEYGGTAYAVQQLLSRTVMNLGDGATAGTLRDANGQEVGSWALTTD
jgi:hypothetical protein